MADPPVITYTLEQVFDGINNKLAKLEMRHEQESKRMDSYAARLSKIEEIVLDELPKIRQFMEDQNVQAQVEAALDSRRVRGISFRDRMVVGGLSACILVVALWDKLAHLIGGH